VQIFEVGDCDGRPYLALEFADGGSLAARLDGTPWPAGTAAALAETLAQAAHAAHQCGIIHRDLKPANILLRGKAEIRDPKTQMRATSEIPHPKEGGAPISDGEFILNFGYRISDFEPKITDFGLAKRVEGDSTLTQTGMIVGTPSYMAPEQAAARKDLGPAADV
jgi:serine/threonine-protein kinase